MRKRGFEAGVLVSNRVEGWSIQPYADRAPDVPPEAPEAPGTSERALRAIASERLDVFASTADGPDGSVRPSAGPPNLRPSAGSASARPATSQRTANADGRRVSARVGATESAPIDSDGASDAGSPNAQPATERSGSDGGSTDDSVGCPNDDFDRCVDQTVLNPSLWIEQGTDANAIDRADVQQQQIGDCHVMAVLAGLANTNGGRALLRGAITENMDSSGQVLSYRVTLHHPQRHWFSATTFTDRQVVVPPVYVRGHAETRPGDGHNEVWVAVMERAYAQYSGGYNAMGHGGRVPDAMEIITGRPARSYGLGPLFGRYGAADLQRDLQSGNIVVVASRRDVEQSRPDLVPNHAYLVTGLEMQGGLPAVRLWNPWGIIQPAPVPFDKLRSLFLQLDVGAAQ